MENGDKSQINLNLMKKISAKLKSILVWSIRGFTSVYQIAYTWTACLNTVY